MCLWRAKPFPDSGGRCCSRSKHKEPEHPRAAMFSFRPGSNAPQREISLDSSAEEEEEPLPPVKKLKMEKIEPKLKMEKIEPPVLPMRAEPVAPPSAHAAVAKVERGERGLFERAIGTRPDVDPTLDLPAATKAMETSLASQFRDSCRKVVDKKGGESDEDEEEENDDLQQLKQAAKHGFVVRKKDKISMEWNNAMTRDAELREAYKAIEAVDGKKKRDLQQEFKRDWAERLFKAETEKRRKTTASRNVDSTSARYRAFGVIVVQEGQDAAAYEAAVNYVSTAAALQRGGIKWRGRDWCRFNKFTKRIEWLYVEETFRSEMEEAWEKFEEGGGCVDGEQQQPALADVGTPAKTVAPTAAHKGRRGIAGGSDCAATLASTGAAKPDEIVAAENGIPEPTSAGDTVPAGEPDKQPKARQGKNGEPEKTPDGNDDKPGGRGKPRPAGKGKTEALSADDRKTLAAIWKKITSLKSEMSAAMSTTLDTINLIQKDPKWKWASYGEILTPLRQARNDVETLKDSSDFMKTWNMEDDPVKAIKAKFTVERIRQESLTSIVKMDEAVKRLAQRVSKLKNAHAELHI